MVADGSLEQSQVDRIFADADAAAGNAPKLAPLQAGPRTLTDVMAEALVARGIKTQAEVDAMRAADEAGVEPAATSKPDTLVDPESDQLDQTMASAFSAPATPADYRLEIVDGYVPEAGSNFREVAHAAGLDQPMTKLLYDSHNKVAERGIPDAETLSREGREGEWTMRRMWGPSFDENVAYARAEVQRVSKFEPGLIGYLNATGLGNDPRLVAAFASRGRARSGSKS